MDFDKYAQRVAEYSARRSFEKLCAIATEFKNEYSTLVPDGGRCIQPPGSSKKYDRGWAGAWDMMIDGGDGLADDIRVKSRTVKKIIEYSSVIDVLLGMERRDAIPKSASCATEVREALRFSRTAPTEEARSLATTAIAMAYVHATDESMLPGVSCVRVPALIVDFLSREWEQAGLPPMPSKPERIRKKRAKPDSDSATEARVEDPVDLEDPVEIKLASIRKTILGVNDRPGQIEMVDRIASLVSECMGSVGDLASESNER